MGAYYDAILAEHPNTLVVHLPLSETIPGVVTDLGNASPSFVNVHDGVTGSHDTIVQGETASAQYNLLGNTHGELGYVTNLRSVRIWFKAESTFEEIISFGRSDDIYQDVRVYLKDGVIKVDVDNTTIAGTTPVSVGAKTFLFIQLIHGAITLYINGAPDDSSEFRYAGIDTDYEFDWYRISSLGTTDSLIDEAGDDLQDQLGNYLVTASQINNLLDASGNTLTDGTNTLF